VATAFDRRDNRITASRVIWVYNPSGDGTVSSRFRNLELSVSKNRLDGAGEITCLLKSRYADAHVCLTLEGRDIYQYRVVRLRGNITPVTFNVDASYAPNFYISAVMQRKRALYTATENISIPVEGTALNVAIKPDRETYLPGETARVEIQATDGKGAPLRADLSLAAVDEAIYSIRRDHTPRMEDFFYSRISNWVLTSYSYPITLLAGAGKDGGVRPRQDFRDTAYWKADIRTDEKGSAAVSFKLPDNLTTWRLTARGHDRSGRVGEKKQNFLVTQDLVARIARPRFMVEGDNVSLLGIVNSNTNRGLQRVETAMKVNDMPVKPDSDISISLPAYASARKSYAITVPGDEKMALRFDALADEKARDALLVSVPVERRGSAFKMSGYGDMNGNSTLTLVPVKGGDDFEFVPERVMITVNPSPITQMIKGLEYLVKYPYGCVEQTVNSFMPVLVLHKFLMKQGSAAILSIRGIIERIREKTIAGLKRLEQIQNDDGTWGWWAGDAGNAYLTAYAMQSLYIAGNLGYEVESAVINRGVAAIRRMLGGENISDDADRAYMLYVYSLFGKWDSAAFDRLYRLNGRNSYLASYLVRALANRKGMSVLDGSDKVKNEESRKEKLVFLLSLLKSQVKKDSRGIYWEPVPGQQWGWQGGRTEITAHVLSAFVASGEASTMSFQALQSISRRGCGEAWSSTKETGTVHIFLCGLHEQE
jgi:uncharacterized protein YfaS (alpha-2-macroglobulin family)